MRFLIRKINCALLATNLHYLASTPVILIVISLTIIHQCVPMCFLPARYWLVTTTVRKMSCLRANKSLSLSGKRNPPGALLETARCLSLHENIHANKSPRSQGSIKSLSHSLSVLSGKSRPFIYICNLDM